MSANLIISSGDTYLTLLCFGSNLTDIVEQETVTEEALLTAPPFMLTYENNTITGILKAITYINPSLTLYYVSRYIRTHYCYCVHTLLVRWHI